MGKNKFPRDGLGGNGTVSMPKTIIQLGSKCAGCVIAVAVPKAGKCNSHEADIHSPSDSSIDLNSIGKWSEYSLPSIYSSAKSIKCRQCGE